MSGPESQQNDVVVIVDQARNDGASLQVDPLDARAGLRLAPGRREAVAVGQHARDDAVARIHRVDLAVHEQQAAAERAIGARALRVRGQRRAETRSAEEGGHECRERGSSRKSGTHLSPLSCCAPRHASGPADSRALRRGCKARPGRLPSSTAEVSDPSAEGFCTIRVLARRSRVFTLLAAPS